MSKLHEVETTDNTGLACLPSFIPALEHTHGLGNEKSSLLVSFSWLQESKLQALGLNPDLVSPRKF